MCKRDRRREPGVQVHLRGVGDLLERVTRHAGLREHLEPRARVAERPRRQLDRLALEVPCDLIEGGHRCSRCVRSSQLQGRSRSMRRRRSCDVRRVSTTRQTRPMARRSVPSRATLLALEAPRAVGELGLLAAWSPMLALSPRGDGHTVLVMPGLGASDVCDRSVATIPQVARLRRARLGARSQRGPDDADAGRSRTTIPGRARTAR